ncbi:MAG: DUF983 domain-containing protein [Sphingomicrobium sp.]
MEEGSIREPDPLAAAIKGHCPRCDSPGLFVGLVKFSDKCGGCGLDFASFNVGDGPAAFLILIVGAIVTGGAIWLELSFSPPGWAHLIWIPVAFGLTIAGLRLAKAMLLAMEYKHRAAEGRIGK